MKCHRWFPRIAAVLMLPWGILFAAWCEPSIADGAQKSSVGTPQGSVFEDAGLKDKINEEVTAYLASNPHSAALALGVVRGNREGVAMYGTVRPGGGEAPDPKNLFRIASISKTFTATLLALYLQSHPNHQLEDPLADYLPEGTTVPGADGRTIELVDLATHTAGLPLYPGELQPTLSPDALCHWLSGFQLQSRPGVKFFYSNSGFSLLGVALENAEHQEYPRMVEEQILKPLGMVDSQIILDEEHRARKLTGYSATGSAIPDVQVFWPVTVASGGIYSTIGDMMKWLHFNLGQVDSPLNSILPVVHEPRHLVNAAGEQVGLAWQMSPASGKVHRVFKSGARNGFHSFMIFDEEHKTGVVVLTNYVNNPSKLAAKIMDLL